MEQLDYNFLFRWFVGLSIDDPVWDVTVFTKNRDRLLKGKVAEGVLRGGVGASSPVGFFIVYKLNRITMRRLANGVFTSPMDTLNDFGKQGEYERA
jgi:hypothetical protein